MRIIAHRGASSEAPENTLAAFRLALDLGVEMIELDVRLTRDGIPVVIHDAWLARTTDGEGPVAETAFATLRRHSAGAWFDRRFERERVPRLEEVFELVRDRAGLNVEIKAESRNAEQTARAALGVTREAGAVGRTLFSCFDPGPLGALRAEGPDIRLALLTGPSSLSTALAPGSPEPAAGILERMDRWRALALEAACVHRSLVNASLVAKLHGQGWAVYVYTVDGEAAAERLDSMGVDGIFANDPARLLRRWPPAIPRPPA